MINSCFSRAGLKPNFKLVRTKWSLKDLMCMVFFLDKLSGAAFYCGGACIHN